MAATIKITLSGERVLFRKLAKLKGPIQRRVTRKAVNAALKPLVRAVKSNVPRDIDGEGLLAGRWPDLDLRAGGALRTVTKTGRKGKRRQRSRRVKDLSTVLRRSIGKRVQTYRHSGVTFGVVGPRTRIKVEIGKRTSASGRKSAQFIAVTTLARLVEVGTSEVPAQPFVRRAAFSQRAAIVREFRHKMSADIVREARRA